MNIADQKTHLAPDRRRLEMSRTRGKRSFFLVVAESEVYVWAHKWRNASSRWTRQQKIAKDLLSPIEEMDRRSIPFRRATERSIGSLP